MPNEPVIIGEGAKKEIWFYKGKVVYLHKKCFIKYKILTIT